MQATYHGGLTGKARSIKFRNRVERIRAQQLLDEYFDEDGEDRPRPHIRFGRRSDFLPAVDDWTSDSATFETGDQLELSLVGEKAQEQSAAATSNSQAATAIPDTAIDPAPKPATKVIPASYWARPKIAFQPAGGRNVSKSFDPKRFLVGCALGSAAAAAILMIVSTVVH